MGAWGYGSFENDSGMDFLSNLINEKEIEKLLKKKDFQDWDYDSIRITSEVLIHLHKINKFWVKQSTLDGLIEKLEFIINDDEWFESWDDNLRAKLLKKQLKKFISQLSNLEGY